MASRKILDVEAAGQLRKVRPGRAAVAVEAVTDHATSGREHLLAIFEVPALQLSRRQGNQILDGVILAGAFRLRQLGCLVGFSPTARFDQQSLGIGGSWRTRRSRCSLGISGSYSRRSMCGPFRTTRNTFCADPVSSQFSGFAARRRRRPAAHRADWLARRPPRRRNAALRVSTSP